jgi:hypothetical protein
LAKIARETSAGVLLTISSKRVGNNGRREGRKTRRRRRQTQRCKKQRHKTEERFKRGITLTPQKFDSCNDDLLRGSGIDKERGREREKKLRRERERERERERWGKEEGR